MPPSDGLTALLLRARVRRPRCKVFEVNNPEPWKPRAPMAPSICRHRDAQVFGSVARFPENPYANHRATGRKWGRPCVCGPSVLPKRVAMRFGSILPVKTERAGNTLVPPGTANEKVTGKVAGDPAPGRFKQAPVGPHWLCCGEATITSSSRRAVPAEQLLDLKAVRLCR